MITTFPRHHYEDTFVPKCNSKFKNNEQQHSFVVLLSTETKKKNS